MDLASLSAYIAILQLLYEIHTAESFRKESLHVVFF